MTACPSGLKAYHANLVSSLNVLSARNHRSGQLSYASAHGKGGKLVLINAWTFSWASAGIYLGIVGLVICTGGAGAVVLGTYITVAGLGAAAIGVAGE